MDENILEIRRMTIGYESDAGLVRAVNGIDLSIGKRKTLGLVGETGAGKTTTALGIMRLVPVPQGRVFDGTILFNGEDLLLKSAAEMRTIRGEKIAMIFQDPMTALNPVLTVGEQISEAIRLHERCSRAEAMVKARSLLELVGIRAERLGDYPHQFSGGMRQRVVIAMALSCNPDLLIADEPTTALDVTIQAQVLELISSLKAKFGMSMLLITHDLGIVAETCDETAIMYAGEIVERGPILAVFSETAHPYTKGLFASLPDPEHPERRLAAINGLTPDPTALPAGCHFHPRCPLATELCAKETPPDRDLGAGHRARCHYASLKKKGLSNGIHT